MHVPVRVRLSALALALLTAAAGISRDTVQITAAGLPAQDQGPAERAFTVSARKYTFSPPRIEVRQDDIVKITLQSEDIPHSFTVDSYRIAKRVSPGHPIVFEFRADQAGAFPFYCNLTNDEKCRDMHGELVVRPR